MLGNVAAGPVKVTVGADPELFAIDKDGRWGRKGRLVPGFYALGGDKEFWRNPANSLELPYGDVRPDGAAVEFTLHPAHNADEFIKHMTGNIRETSRIVQDNAGCGLSCQPMMDVAWRYIKELDESYGDGTLQKLGCNPDMIIWSGAEQQRPDPKKYNKRTSGGHLHFYLGPDVASDWPMLGSIVGLLDQIVGCAGAYLLDNEHAALRMTMYGRAGTIRAPRPDKNVLEYRTGPSQLSTHDAYTTYLLVSIAQNAVQWAVDNYHSHGDSDRTVGEIAQFAGDFDYMQQVAGFIDSKNMEATRAVAFRLAQIAPNDMSIRKQLTELLGQKLPKDTFEVNW